MKISPALFSTIFRIYGSKDAPFQKLADSVLWNLFSLGSEFFFHFEIFILLNLKIFSSWNSLKILCQLSRSGILFMRRAMAATKPTAPKRHKSNESTGAAAAAIDRLVWIDCEMTGLEPEKDVLLEIASIVTESDLTQIGEGVDVSIRQPDSVLDQMGDWCKKHHGESGLTELCRKSQFSVSEAENLVLEYIQPLTIAKKCVLAGNTVWMDRIFLDRYMPKLVAHLHYRIIDVSTIKELCRRWNSNVFDGAPPKKLAHRALDDIKESIEELKFYRQNFMKIP